MARLVSVLSKALPDLSVIDQEGVFADKLGAGKQFTLSNNAGHAKKQQRRGLRNHDGLTKNRSILDCKIHEDFFFKSTPLNGGSSEAALVSLQASLSKYIPETLNAGGVFGPVRPGRYSVLLGHGACHRGPLVSGERRAS